MQAFQSEHLSDPPRHRPSMCVCVYVPLLPSRKGGPWGASAWEIYICMYIHIHIYIYIYKHIYIYIYIYIYVYIYMCAWRKGTFQKKIEGRACIEGVCLWICIYVNVCAYTYTYTQTCCVYMYIQMYLHIHICIYMYKYVLGKKIRKVLFWRRFEGRAYKKGPSHTYTLIVYTYTQIVYLLYTHIHIHKECTEIVYGVATMSRMLKNICLFAEYRSLS